MLDVPEAVVLDSLVELYNILNTSFNVEVNTVFNLDSKLKQFLTYVCFFVSISWHFNCC